MPDNASISKLVNGLAGSGFVLVTGTGISAALSERNDYCSWPGLLRAGVSYVTENGLSSHQKLIDSILSDIEIGSELDGSYLLAAAQKLSQIFGGASSVRFSDFLRTTIGQLKLTLDGKQLAKVLGEANVPLLTVNYDTLLDSALGRPHTTWRDPRTMRSALSGASNHVAHLHGIWDDPESIVLTTSDYDSIVGQPTVEALRNAIGTIGTLVFLGFGDGLVDPHFTALWQYLKNVVPSGVMHYALCVDGDLTRMNEQVRALPILPIGYGPTHRNLRPFLENVLAELHADGVQDAAVERARLTQTCRLRILDQLTDGAVLPRTGGVIAAESADVDDLVIEPVWLPVTPEQFARERAESTDIDRLNPVEEITSNKALTLVGEEQTGVTTSVAWSAIKHADTSQSIPILLNYMTLGSGQRMIQNAVRKYLRSAGGSLSASSPLPSNLALAIDNVTSSSLHDLERLVRDVEALEPSFVIYGCRPGTEMRIQRIYDELGAAVRPIFLGRLGLSDAVKLARKVDPDQASPVATRVLNIAHKEGLSRTPLSLTLLIIGVTNDDGWISAVSNTSFVDSFVDSLLGRGALADDMHLQIDSAGYSRVLEALAKRLIAEDSASILRVELIKFFGSIVTALDWTDNPDDIIKSLIHKGILIDRDSVVRFRQSAYLHIFAARACRVDAALVGQLQERPLYYGTILRNYAALQRDDSSFLRWASDLIEDLEVENEPSGGIYSELTDEQLLREGYILPEANPADETDDYEDGQDERELEPEPSQTQLKTSDGEPPSGGVSSSDPNSDNQGYDPYETMVDIDRDPFPSTDLDRAAPDMRMTALLSLVSNILRDSELVEDPDLKEHVMIRILRSWGVYLSYVYESETLNSMVKTITEVIADRLNIQSDEDKDDLRERLSEGWALYDTALGLGEDLATVKLSRALQRVTSDELLFKQLHLVLPALLLQNATSDKWPDSTSQLLAERHKVRAVRIFINIFVFGAYYRSPPGTARSRQLEEVLLEYVFAEQGEVARRRAKATRTRILKMIRERRRRVERGLPPTPGTQEIALGSLPPVQSLGGIP